MEFYRRPMFRSIFSMHQKSPHWHRSWPSLTLTMLTSQRLFPTLRLFDLRHQTPYSLSQLIIQYKSITLHELDPLHIPLLKLSLGIQIVECGFH